MRQLALEVVEAERQSTNLPDKGLDATGTTVDLVEGDLTEDLVAILPDILVSGRRPASGLGGARALLELLDLLDLLGDLGGEGFLQRL